MKNLANLIAQILYSCIVAIPAMLFWDNILIPLTYFEPIEYHQAILLVVMIRTIFASIKLEFN